MPGKVIDIADYKIMLHSEGRKSPALRGMEWIKTVEDIVHGFGIGIGSQER